MYIDTHAHLYLKHFKDDIDKVVHDAKRKGVDKVFLPNIDSSSTSYLLDLTDRFPDFFYPMIGLHPGSVKEDFKNELDHVKDKLSKRDFIAVGEIGTDLYWDKTFKEEQIEAFEQQILWAKDYELPIVIHARDSMDLTIDLVEKHMDASLKGVFHCFTGNVEQAERIMNLNFFMGIGGILTYKNSGLKEVLREIPPEFLLLETDAPFLPPVPHRGRRNESSFLPIIAQHLSMVLGITPVELAEITTNNAIQLFNID